MIRYADGDRNRVYYAMAVVNKVAVVLSIEECLPKGLVEEVLIWGSDTVKLDFSIDCEGLNYFRMLVSGLSLDNY